MRAQRHLYFGLFSWLCLSISFAQTRWTNQTPDVWLALQGNGMYVTSGENFRVSRDTTNWITLPLGPFSQLRFGAFGNDRFVISQGKSTYISNDGYNWTRHEKFDSSRVIYARGEFWTFSSPYTSVRPRAVYSSVDAISWRSRFETSDVIYDLAHGNGIFLATATADWKITHVYVSTNGSNWTSQESSRRGQRLDLSFSHEKFFAFGGGNLFVSSNGFDWVEASLASTSSVNQVFWVGNRYLALSSNGDFQSSPDGLFWSLERPGDGDYYPALLNTGDRLIAFGPNGKTIESRNVGEWTRVVPPTGRMLSDAWKVLFWNNHFYATGTEGIFKSRDGFHWEASVPGAGYVYSFVPTSTNLLAFSNDGKVYRFAYSRVYSFNMDLPVIPFSVAHDGTRYVAAADGAIYNSTNALNWQLALTNEYNIFRHLAFGNGKFFASGGRWSVACPAAGGCTLPDPSEYPTYSALSTDGLTWTHVKIEENESTCTDLLFENGKFLAVMDVFNPRLFISEDGLGWVRVNSFPGQRDGNLCFANGRFFYFHFGAVSISADGEIWKSYSLNSSANSVAYGNHRFLAGGGDLLISLEDFFLRARFLPHNEIELVLDPPIGTVLNLQKTEDFENWTSFGTIGGAAGSVMRFAPANAEKMFYRVFQP